MQKVFLVEHFSPKYVYALPPMYSCPYDLLGLGVSGLTNGSTDTEPGSSSFFGIHEPGFSGNEVGRANFTVLGLKDSFLISGTLA